MKEGKEGRNDGGKEVKEEGDGSEGRIKVTEVKEGGKEGSERRKEGS